MKKLFLVLACVVLTTVLLVGCIPGITPTPEPEEPAPVMEANVTAELVESEVVQGGWAIDWTIVNTGDVNIFKYVITFRVYYPMLLVEKDYVEVEVTDTALAVGTHHGGVFELADYGYEAVEDPWSVSATWELSE